MVMREGEEGKRHKQIFNSISYALLSLGGLRGQRSEKTRTREEKWT